MADKKRKKLAVIGTGPAGLTAVYEMLRNSKNHNVIVDEGGDLVGGIARTETHHGYRFDIGGLRCP